MLVSEAAVVQPPALPPRMASLAAVGGALVGQRPGDGRAVLDVDDAPLPAQPVAVLAAVAGGAAVVDLGDADAP